MLGASEATFPLAKEYLKIILAFNPAFIFASAFIVFVRNDGEPKLAMYAVIGSNTTNIVLDYVFIYIFNLGMFWSDFSNIYRAIGSFRSFINTFYKEK